MPGQIPYREVELSEHHKVRGNNITSGIRSALVRFYSTF